MHVCILMHFVRRIKKKGETARSLAGRESRTLKSPPELESV